MFIRKKRGQWRSARLVRRRSDGSLWAARCPQNAGYAFLGLFSGRAAFHFCRARIWRGRVVVSRKLIWHHIDGKFDLAGERQALWLPPWREAVECAKIDGARRHAS